MRKKITDQFKGCILAVDDTPASLLLLISMLSEQGYKVQTITDGELAFNSALAHPPDLILLDTLIGGMDGYQLCQRLKKSSVTQDIPVIFISALSNSFDKVKAFDVGGVDYISKPFHPGEVIARVESQLRLKTQNNQLIEQNKILQAEIEERIKIEQKLRQSEARESQKSAELEITLGEFKKTQNQLIQTEKLSSIGQLVAGVAHEINNPLSFISGNLTYAGHYFQELLNLLELYRKNYPNPPLEIQQLTDDIDLPFLIEDWFKLSKSMQVGTKRIQQIVDSLKFFCRRDESKLTTIDLNQCIENTLFILQHRLGTSSGSSIEVIRNYGELPEVTGYSSQLNQVFLNLLNNAIDALECKAFQRKIIVSTSVENQQPFLAIPFVMIKIADNGSGIKEEVFHKIFDPFFTTKPIGSSRGLGLSITHQIVVERHKGRISCVSTPDKGTEFIVQIPANQENWSLESLQKQSQLKAVQV